MCLNSQQPETAAIYFWSSTCPVILLSSKMKSFLCPELLARELNSWARNSLSPYESYMPLALCSVFLQLHWKWHYLGLQLQECIKEEAAEGSAGHCANTEQSDPCSPRKEQMAALGYVLGWEHEEVIRQECFGVIVTRCLTVDRCLLIYAIVSLEEPGILDIKVVTVLCPKKLFKVTFWEVVIINYYLFSVAC